MKNFMVIALLVVLSGVGIWKIRTIEQAKRQDGDKPVVRIGAILPLTGNLAGIGVANQRGIIMAERDLPSNTKYQYEVIFEDNANDTKNTKSIATRMLEVDGVNAIISSLDPTANVIAPMAANKKVVHFGGSWVPEYLKYDYNFNVYPIIKKEVALMAETLAERGHKNVVVFTANQSGFIKCNSFIEEEFRKNEINICKNVKFNFGQKTFKSEIYGAKECNPDIYILQSFSPEIDIINKQLKEIVGEDVKMTGIDLALNVDDVKPFSGHWFVGTAVANAGFLMDYENIYDDESYMHTMAGIGHDELNLMVYAFENAPAEEGQLPKPEDVRDVLANIKDFRGVFGDVSVNVDRWVDMPFDILKIKNGKVVKE